MSTTDMLQTKVSDATTDPIQTLTIQPVILAGGSGSRLWPLSRKNHPKQLIGLLAEESLLATTAHRLDGLADPLPVTEQLILVCGEQHGFMSAEQLRKSGKPMRILLEPHARNTSPALTAAALSTIAHNGDAIMVVMPADHAVPDTEAFHAAVSQAVCYAVDGAIVTMGVAPHRAETGYGYVRVGPALGQGGGYAIDRFVEKPRRELAEQYVHSGEYLWNSGIFVVRASVWLTAISTLRPDIFSACQAAYRDGSADGQFFRLDPCGFERCPADSIDYAVMERLGENGDLFGVVVPLNAAWSDIGSWDAIWRLMPKDAAGNAARGRVIFEETTASFAHSQGRLIACVGLHDIVVVETPDAILVANKRHAQQVQAVASRIRAEHGSEADTHRKVHRPWGYYESVDAGDRFLVKRIVVEPGARLSLQMHHHRAEHWVVVHGTAKVTCGDNVFLLGENQSTFIPLGTTHRLENPGKTLLEIIEVQSGSYLGEDDIVRLEDNYGRAE